MISLLYRILGDASPLKRTLDGTSKDAREAGTAAGKFFGQQFKSQVLRFVGAGAIISQIQKLMAESIQIQTEARGSGQSAEAVQVWRRAAEETGIAVEELKSAAPELADKLSKLIGAIKDSGGILDDKTVQEFANASRDLKEFGNSVLPIIARFLLRSADGLGRIHEGLKGAGAMYTAQMYAEKAAGATGADKERYRALARQYKMTAIESMDIATGKDRFTVGQTAVGESASDVSAAVLAGRQRRANEAASWLRAIPEISQTVSAGSRGVPFMSGIAEDMLKEMKKSTAELERLSSVMNQKL